MTHEGFKQYVLKDSSCGKVYTQSETVTKNVRMEYSYGDGDNRKKRFIARERILYI